MKTQAEIGIIGGSGFYEFLDKTESFEIKTPYGDSSDKITIGEYKGKKIAFLPRHGRHHHLPPHKIPYQANIFALKSLGVKHVISPTAVGSLKKEFKPGDFVICDQFINMTQQREATYYSGPKTIHISSADPYCSSLRIISINQCKNLNLPFHKKGTAVIVEGPRFSTRAESRWFSKMGADVINMTQYPEVVLAREAGMCYLNISIVTDYDAGLKGEKGTKPASAKKVIEMFEKNIKNLQKLIFSIIEKIPKERNCQCGKALEGAVM